MIITKELIARGKVQKVGFRNFIDETAFKLNINGIVENLADKTVKIVCQGEKDVLEKFVQAIKIKEYPINVTEIAVRTIETIKLFETFEVIPEKDPIKGIYERADEGALYTRLTFQKLNELNNKTDDFRQETNSNFNKLFVESKDHTVVMKKILEKEDEHKNLTGKFAEKTDKNFQILGEKTGKFNQDTNINFDKMDKKYHTISESLQIIAGKFKK